MFTTRSRVARTRTHTSRAQGWADTDAHTHPRCWGTCEAAAQGWGGHGRARTHIRGVGARVRRALKGDADTDAHARTSAVLGHMSHLVKEPSANAASSSPTQEPSSTGTINWNCDTWSK